MKSKKHFEARIKYMQQNKEDSLNEIQLKLNEINQVKDHLKATNYFKPKLFSLNQEGDTSLFGLINLDVFSIRNSLKSSCKSWLNCVNSHQMTNGHCCIVVQEMDLVLKILMIRLTIIIRKRVINALKSIEIA